LSYHPLPWTLDSLDLNNIQIARIRHHEDLFFLLCSSSFVESAADLHTQNLVDHFAGNPELQSWLTQHWEHEEVQHARALTAQLEPNRGLELAARCVVETSTANLYRALHDLTDEPVLQQLTNHIKGDEVRHYKHFYQHFRVYRERERFGRYKVFRAILRRVNELRRADNDIALRHVFKQCYPQFIGDEKQFRRVSDRAQILLRRHLPTDMTLKMLLKPLDLPARLLSALQKPLTRLTGRLLY